MEKVEIIIKIGKRNGFVIQKDWLSEYPTVIVKSLEDLENFMKSPIDFFDDGDKEILKEKANNVYNGIVYKKFIINSLEIDKNDNSLDDIVKIINLLKNKIEYLFLDDLDVNDLTELCNRIDLGNNITISTKYNYRDLCTKDELIVLLKYLENIKSLITRYNLSPLEICIFVNDLIRERKYKKSSLESKETSDISKEDLLENGNGFNRSRSLFKIIKNDEIVCTGFSNLYSVILNMMNIKSDKITYLPIDDNDRGHAANIVHIYDEKYGINGLFEIDTTWGRVYNKDNSYNYQKSIENYRYFANCLYFAKFQKKFEKLKMDYPIIDKLIDALNQGRDSINMYSGFPFFIQSSLAFVLSKCEALNQKYGNRLLNEEIAKIKQILKEKDFTDTERILDLYNEIELNLCTKELDFQAFKEALYRVKIVEHSIDKDKYPLSEESFMRACKSKDGIIGRATKEKISFNEEKELDVARASLISVLHKIAGDNVDKNPTMYKK